MRLRVLEGLPRREGEAAASPLATRRLLGEAPVADDGSFQVQIPANVPVQLQILDGDGLALRSGAWIWARNHFNQGCVGCHEDPERTPPNRFVKALVSPAPQLTLPVALRRTVDYRHEVAPIVAARCVACHGEGGKPPDLRAEPGAPEAGAAGTTPDTAYRTLLERFVQPGRARASRLIWHLFGRNTSRPWDPESASRDISTIPGGGQPLTDEERRTIVEWIDMGAAWDAKPSVLQADGAAPAPAATGGR
jgi:cytochrome c553